VKAKKPRFFCDNCGTEVSGSTEKCPKCGRFFVSVRCPACGYIGEGTDFTKGCPVCGYSTKPGGDRREIRFPQKKAGGALPLWVYLLTGTAFIVVVAALYFSFFRH
jgi:RNA polymerase subunit RPABC4/transcription elongation factor Spt4